jgi:hypothetical protein
MVQVIGISDTYPSALRTVVADGKPHKEIEINLAAEADITPMMLVAPCGVAATTWDLNVVASANIIWANGFIAITQIPADYPGRDVYDRTTAYSASDTKVPAVPLEIGREYFLKTATDMTLYNQGQILVPAANGDVAKVTDESPDSLVCLSHGFMLIYCVSTTEIVVKYLGLIPVDMA